MNLDVSTPRALGRARDGGGVWVLVAIMIVALAGRDWLVTFTELHPRVQAFATVFVAIFVQALPFLVFGIVVSACVSAFIPAGWFERVVPDRPHLAVPVGAAAGLALPGCECASVPIAGSLMRHGVSPPAGLAFLLAAPAVNPIVLVATSIAFPGEPMMVVARLVASFLAACAVGWVWLHVGRPGWMPGLTRRAPDGRHSRAETLRASALHDLLHAGGFLVVGGFAAAALNVVLPSSWLDRIAANEMVAIGGLALLAFVLSICSEADAFVAASLTQFSLTSRLVFLVVGPMVDLKLVAMQCGTFGRSFGLRFAPLTFVVATMSAVAVGGVLL
jgi:uncharacterized protein